MMYVDKVLLLLIIGAICVFSAENGTEHLGDAEYYQLFAANVTGDEERTVYYRPGTATNTHSCSHIRRYVPSTVRSQLSLSSFYQKYTEAYGIPILSSGRVPDRALQRACYVARFLFADRYDIRNQYYRRNGRLAVMAQSEFTRSIPEHAFLGPYWDTRARGLGATPQVPVSTCAEENALCYSNDRYHDKDIVLHEFAHGLHLVGANFAMSGFDRRLTQAYNSARSRGLWYNTYSLSTRMEYFAEGVSAYFGQKGEANPPNGIDNWVNTRQELYSYDPTLYQIVKEIFPCGNEFIHRCRDTSQGQSLRAQLKINYPACTVSGGGGGGGVTTTQAPPTGACTDENSQCAGWASQGECSKNPEYMLESCKKSCGKCGGGVASCTDQNSRCGEWARKGECTRNQNYMLSYCKRSCGRCGGGTTCTDQNSRCGEWASKGECSKNPRYMLSYCKRSCRQC